MDDLIPLYQYKERNNGIQNRDSNGHVAPNRVPGIGFHADPA
eukprot:CAMPEP_0184685462 /NCGR_PEP_ID=MMETSP0312-20130426/19090_1 /TAXON_ID=31354 /ORGANISM="Compsopogon coeruleus, Strain SAG 36.94" /LENGTH=41 /DNA_ID= /DNA_START= /DNA_END= /DNA_ORIENTATION=